MARVRTVDSHTHILTEEAMRLLGKEAPKVVPVLKDVSALGSRRKDIVLVSKFGV